MKSIIKISKFFIPVMLILAMRFSAESAVILNHTKPALKVSEDIKHLVDKTNRSAIEDILTTNPYRWSILDDNTPGFSPHTHWFKFKVTNNYNAPYAWVLKIDYPLLDYLDVHVTRDKTIVENKLSGDQRNFNSRDFDSRYFMFKIIQEPGTYEIYIRIKSDSSIPISPTIYSLNEISYTLQVELFWIGLFYGIIILIIFYNLLLYISIRDKSYIFYVLWLLFYGLYHLSITGLGTQHLWVNNRWWANVSVPFFMFISIGFICQFGKYFLEIKRYFPLMRYVLNTLSIINFILSLASLIVPYYIIIKAFTFVTLITPLYLFSLGIAVYFKGYKPARFYIIGYIFMFIGIPLFILKALGVVDDSLFVKWCQEIGTSIEVIIISVAMTDRINSINKDKSKTVERVNTELLIQHEMLSLTNENISLSTKKYKMILDNTEEIILLLDLNLNIISANHHACNFFNIPLDKILNKNFLDFLYNSPVKGYINRKMVEEKFKEISLSRNDIEFKTDFISSSRNEPQLLNVELKYIGIAGKREIFCRAHPVVMNKSQNMFISGGETLAVDNLLLNVEEITHRLTKNLYKYMDSSEIMMIKLALREVIINAIEHGNLSITYDEKSEHLEKDSYFDLLYARRTAKENQNKRVLIEYSITPRRATYRITDEGKGFNHKAMLDSNQLNPMNQIEFHGRGLHLVKGIFDSITYNQSGNSVELSKSI